ncbi:CBS domain-containing protein [Paracoccus suum]|uniref:CBS domain-containing protein n=1 Tax=Paracoccus suum TaxID=2259340 RepID=A0A344PH64_9RHOB|nr:CBS domain-containing protein [Paracoccus suum]AXC48719.1 CBS domain-containing protein [Paracoccus suum]
MLVNQILVMKTAPQGGNPVVTIAPDARVEDAARTMAELRIGALVVSEDGQRPVGILSERDIVREIGRRGGGILNEPVQAIMTGRIMTCHSGDDALAVLERMTEGRFRHLPVVDEDGIMLGLVSIGDAVSGRLKELAAEKDALTGMIMGV